MKNFLIFILTIVFITSCSTEDELDKITVEVTASDVAGTWKVNEFYLQNGKISTTIQGIPTTANLELDGKDFNTTITFVQNPNTVTSNGSFTVVTKVSYFTFSYSEEYEENININGQWSIADNVLSISESGITQNFEIVEFTGNTIKVKQQFDEDFNNIDGYSGQATGTLYIGFNKTSQ